MESNSKRSNPLDELFGMYSTETSDNLNKPPTLAEQEHYEKHQSNLRDKSRIISTWTRIQSQNMDMRNKFANKLFYLLAFQLFVVDIILILLGASIVKLSDKLIIATVVKAFIELVGFIYVIINYLFKPIDDEIDKLLNKLMEE